MAQLYRVAAWELALTQAGQQEAYRKADRKRGDWIPADDIPRVVGQAADSLLANIPGTFADAFGDRSSCFLCLFRSKRRGLACLSCKGGSGVLHRLDHASRSLLHLLDGSGRSLFGPLGQGRFPLTSFEFVFHGSLSCPAWLSVVYF